MDGSGRFFSAFTAALGGEFNVHVVPYPNDIPLGYDALEKIAKKSLPTSGSFVILGESFSGPMAISLAAQHPPGLIGLVLCSTFARNPRPWLGALRPFVGAAPVKLAPMALISHALLGQFATPALCATLKSAISEVSAAAFQARIKAVLSVDVSAQLKAVKVPLLYLRATQDRLVPINAMQHIAQTFVATQTASIHAPHCLLQVAPVEAAHVVDKFIRQAKNAVTSRP
jgi:pimeloyl-ACP methyl ester carboxylesterase